MSGPLDPLVEQLDEMAASLEPRRRRTLLRQIATGQRKETRRRIRANTDPEGEPFQPRKPRDDAKRGSPRRMFRKAGNKLTLEVRPDEAELEFPGASGRILRVHNDGLRDRVSNEAGAPEVTYARRPLLGFSQADRTRILDQIAAALLSD